MHFLYIFSTGLVMWIQSSTFKCKLKIQCVNVSTSFEIYFVWQAKVLRVSSSNFTSIKYDIAKQTCKLYAYLHLPLACSKYFYVLQ